MIERHRDHRDGREEQQPGQQDGKDFDGEGACLGLAIAFDPLGEERHEGGVEGALGKERAEQVGKALGHEEGLGDRAGAQREGDELIAQEAEERGSPG